MRVEPVIAISATDFVGPSRLRLLTAGSAKLPVVVVADLAGVPAYHVFDVAGLQTALGGRLSATRMDEALGLDGAGSAPVARAEVSAAAPGRPVVENGRLIGVTADDVPEHPEPAEQDMTRGGTSGQDSEPGQPREKKTRGLWQRLTGHNEGPH